MMTYHQLQVKFLTLSCLAILPLFLLLLTVLFNQEEVNHGRNKGGFRQQTTTQTIIEI